MNRYVFALSLGSLVAAISSPALAQEKIDFAKHIQPIFATHCAECHGEQKASAKLRLDSAEAINGFEEKAELLVPGKPDESELYRRITLPEDDKKRMPKGADPLAEADIALIKQWIEQGAVIAVAAAAAPAAEPMPDDPAAKAAAEAKAAEEAAQKADEEALAKVGSAPAEAIEKIKAAGATVMPLFGESPLLQVSFARAESPAGDEAVATLAGAAEQIVWLDLSGAQVSAAGLAPLAELKNLQRLHLEKSSAADDALAHLAGLPRLQYLNLYGTGITDAGLEPLKGLKRLKKLYLWQTKVNYDPAMALAAASPGLEVNLGWDHPGVVKARLTKELETVKKSAEEATAKAAEAQKQLEAANAEKTAADTRLKEVETQLKALEAPPADAKPAEEKPAEEKPAEEKSADEQASADKPAEEKAAEEKPAEAKSADQPPAEAPAAAEAK